MLSKITAIHRTENPSPLFVARPLEGNEIRSHQKTVLTYALGTRKQSFRPTVLLDIHENVFFQKPEEENEHLYQKMFKIHNIKILIFCVCMPLCVCVCVCLRRRDP